MPNRMTSQSENWPGTTPSKGTMRITQVLASSRGANSGLGLHPQGHRLVSGWCGANGGVDLWAVDAGKHLGTTTLDVQLTDVGSQVPAQFLAAGADFGPEGVPAHQLPVVDVAMSASGSAAVVAAGRGVRVFDLSGDALSQSVGLRGHEHAVTRVALDANGTRALSADPTGQILVWDVAAGNTQRMLRISTVPQTVQFIWNDMLAMCGDASGRVVCWELHGGRRHLQFQAHHGAVSSTAFNADSGVLLTAGGDQTARMWNLEEGKQIGRDMMHRSAISDVAFAYAGRFVVTCGTDGHVAVWNSTDGDLLDWYFDGGPVYRVAFDRLNGSIIAAGAKTIKVLSVDWQRLREVDANARASFMVDISPADHAAMFASPPPQQQPTADVMPGQQAPIGSIMAARQTTDLPFPDRSELVIPRSSSSATASNSAGTPAPPVTAGPAPTRAAATQTFGGVGGPSLAEAMASARERDADAAVSRTSYGMAVAQPNPTSQASAFFGTSTSDQPSQRMSRIDSDQLNTGPITGRQAPVIPQESRSKSAVVQANNEPEQAKGLNPARRRMLVAALAVVVAMVATRVGVAWYFTNIGWPAGVAERASEANAEFDQRVEIATEEFEAYEESEQDNIRRYRRSGSMSPDALQRTIERVETRIEQHRGRLDAEIAAAEADRETALGVLGQERASSAGRMANLSAAGAGVVMLLLSMLLMVKPKKKEDEPTPRRRPR